MIAPDWIAHHAHYTPDRVAMTDIHSARTFTYQQMNERCARLAGYFQDRLGLKKGDRVAVLAYNSTDIFEIQFACCKLGAIFVPLNWRLSNVELLAILANAEPKIVVYGSEFQETIDGLISGLAGVHFVELSDGRPSRYEMGISDAIPIVERAQLVHDDVFAIMYTSGTTGRPKGVIITHRMTIFSAVNGMMKAGVDHRSTGLTFLPLFHVGGLFLMANFIFHAGGHNIIMRNFDARAALDLLADADTKISHAFGVPTNFLMMAELPSFADADISHVECLTVGGAPSPQSLLKSYSSKGIGIQQGWGMTETATLGTMLAPDVALHKIGSAGKPVMHAELAIVDEELLPVSRGEVGQLIIRGPTVTPGYWNQPEETAKAFHHGWFLTGDAARQDDDGFIYIVDRWKDMYISGGENVYPAEVENVLQAIPGVLEVAVIGVPDQKWGEVGCAYLVTRPDFALSERDVLVICERALARFKLPRYVHFVDEIPHTAAGKISKPELRSRFKSAKEGNLA